MSKSTKTPRRFVRERRRNACPACLDRNVLTITGQKMYESRSRSKLFGPCQICNGKGYVIEISVVGDEWRRYPWVIVS